jgi:glycosyltransferase involved in cell wall biosynthesis
MPNGAHFDRTEKSQQQEWSIYDVANISRDSILLGNAAMLTEQRDHETLVHAVVHLYNIELGIAGDGELRETLVDLINELDMNGAVHLLGLLERMEVYS